MAFSLTLKGQEKLEKKLIALSRIRWNGVIRRNMSQVYNRGKNGGTPVSTELTRPGGNHGELRLSLGMRGDTVYYTAEYAAHVEYGHRTRNGGYVKGQRYLKKNMETQRPIFVKDLIAELKRA